MDQTDDFNDATWHQAQMDEQAMLQADPGYTEFLVKYSQGNKYGAQANQSDK